MAVEQVLLKVICQHEGALNYEDLEDLVAGLGLTDVDVDAVVENSVLFSVVEINGSKRVVAKTKVRRCARQDCNGAKCDDLHICKMYVLGSCTRGMRCRFFHDLNSEHNSRVLRDNQLDTLSKQEIQQLLLQNDNTFLPPVCNFYNQGSGTYGNCHNKEKCRMLHVCGGYISNTCSAEDCSRCHDLNEPHPRMTLQQRCVPDRLVSSLLPVLRNIQALKRAEQKASTKASSSNRSAPLWNDKAREEICLFFVKSDCKQGDKCWRIHSKMPYKWQMKESQTWTDLADNEQVEKDYCNPSKIKSEGPDQVCFVSMTSGHKQVRRLSTVSWVSQPTYILTTQWAWYWQDDNGHWIKYGSSGKMYGPSSINSEILEKQYLENPSAVVTFTAGNQPYELSFEGMIQKNTHYLTARMVRRRPVFVSSADVQAARTRKNRSHNPAHNAKSLPGFWDKSAIPENGYMTVNLPNTERDYQKVEELFKKTMRGFRIISIERVQNSDLWEDFQKKRDRMKKNNDGKNSKEMILFHGTDSRHLDSICKTGFEWRHCGTNGTVYGEGSYFARDATYSHGYVKGQGVKTMFACRVLVGDYTQGARGMRLPPRKADGSSAYDSCVDVMINPAIYVVFYQDQAYPEFLVKYEEDNCGFGTLPTAAPTSAAIQPGFTPYSGQSQLFGSTANKPTTVQVQYASNYSPSHTVQSTPTSLSPSNPITATTASPLATQTLTPPTLKPPTASSRITQTLTTASSPITRTLTPPTVTEPTASSPITQTLTLPTITAPTASSPLHTPTYTWASSKGRAPSPPEKTVTPSTVAKTSRPQTTPHSVTTSATSSSYRDMSYGYSHLGNLSTPSTSHQLSHFDSPSRVGYSPSSSTSNSSLYYVPSQPRDRAAKKEEKKCIVQ